jgi:hypothetical protein
MDDDLTKLPDDELVRRFIQWDCEPDDPVCVALADEIQRREIDV